MRLFALPTFRDLASELVRPIRPIMPIMPPSLHLEDLSLGRFTNGELHVELRTSVEGADCAVLGTLRPPEQHLGELLLLCDTLRRHGARSIVAVLPYFAYSRQDRIEGLGSLGAAWIGQLLAASGATSVLTLDVHSPQAGALCPIPLSSLDAAALFVPVLEDRLGADVTLVAPDEGAIDRCRRFQAVAGLTRLAHFKKVRTPTGVRSHLVGPVSEHAVVLDDILDTGGTLIACAQGLRAAGVRQIAVAVTHGLFTGAAWRQLWDLGVDRIVCTDSVGGPPPPDARVTVVSCAPALSPALRAYAESRPAKPDEPDVPDVPDV
jgi:ribose-phosphate pyrophosphokinase